MAPGRDLWTRTPLEILWLIEAKTPVKMIGSLTETEVRQIYHQTYGPDP